MPELSAREIWEELGFESQWEWLNHVEAEQSRMLGGPRLRFGPRGSIEVVDPDAEGPVAGPLPSVTRREILETMPGGTKDGRQVGVKLSRDDYVLLARAAAVWGVAPSTWPGCLSPAAREPSPMTKADGAPFQVSDETGAATPRPGCQAEIPHPACA